MITGPLLMFSLMALNSGSTPLHKEYLHYRLRRTRRRWICQGRTSAWHLWWGLSWLPGQLVCRLVSVRWRVVWWAGMSSCSGTRWTRIWISTFRLVFWPKKNSSSWLASETELLPWQALRSLSCPKTALMLEGFSFLAWFGQVGPMSFLHFSIAFSPTSSSPTT